MTAGKSQRIWEQIKKDMDSEAVDVGCTMAVEFAAHGGKVAYVMPDPTASKLVCGIAAVLDSGDAAKEVATRGCKATYAISKNTVIVFLDFAKGQYAEFVKTMAYFEQNLQATYLNYTLKRR